MRRALDSVFAQSFQDYEVIVVDDGSTDDGPEQVETYKDSRLRLIQQPNEGPGAARNRGIHEATGEYVAFLDADDEWFPEYLAKVHQKFKSHPECDFIATAWIQDFYNHPKGMRNVNIASLFPDVIKAIPDEVLGVETINSNFILLNIIKLFSTNTVSIKKKILLNYKGFFEKSSYGEDWFLWVLLLFNHKFFYLKCPLAWYHDSVSSLTGEFWKKPLPAYFLHYKKIYSLSGKKNLNLMNRWFALASLQEAHNRLSAGKVYDVKFLLKNFPLMREVDRWSYFKLMLKYKVPFLRRTKVYS